MRIFAGILALFILTGCGTSRPDADYSGATLSPGDPAGVVIASISRGKDMFRTNFYTLHFRNVNTKDEGTLSMSTPDLSESNFEIAENDYMGFVTSQQLPPGKYEIFNISTVVGTTVGRNTTKFRQDFSIPFEIKPGRITYIGAYECTPVIGEGFFGQPAMVDMYWRLADRSTRDIAIAQRREPPLNTMPADIAVPDLSRLNIPGIKGVTP